MEKPSASQINAMSLPGGMANGAAKFLNCPVLPSLKPPRDLTLGGRPGPAKKVFVPNLNVVRKQNLDVKTFKDAPRGTLRGGKPDRGAARGARGGGRGGRGGRSLIQSQSIFSEGAGAVNARKPASSGSGYGRLSSAAADDGAFPVRRTRIKTSQPDNGEEAKTEAELLKELLDESSEDDEFEDPDKTDALRQPIFLNDERWKNVHIKLENIKVHDEPEIKDEIGLEDPTRLANLDATTSLPDSNSLRRESALTVAQTSATNSCSVKRSALEESFTNKEPCLFLMQMPDVLPFVNEIEEAEKKREAETENLDKLATKKYNPLKGFELRQLDEGKIGKIVRYKSGKMKFVIGGSEFNADIGMETNIFRDVFSLNVNRQERSGNMINIGRINGKMVITPEWDDYLAMEKNPGST